MGSNSSQSTSIEWGALGRNSAPVALHVTMALIGVILGFGLFSGAKVASGYTFDWPTLPYQSDSAGHYAYRDLRADWWGCSGNLCWVGNVGVWANISSPSAGYQYNAWGAHIKGSSSGQINYSAGTTMTFSNTPFWIYTPSSWRADLGGTKWAYSGVCSGSGSGCLPATFVSFASYMRAQIAVGATSGTCHSRQFPLVYYC